MLGVVMDSAKLCGDGSDQIAERVRLEEVTVPQRSITDFFKFPSKGIALKHSVGCHSETTPKDQSKKSINSAETKSKKRKRISDVDLNDSFNDFDNKDQKASTKKAKSTDKGRKKKLSKPITCSPNGSQSGKENEELPVEKTAEKRSKRPDNSEGNTGNQSSKKQNSIKCSRSSRGKKKGSGTIDQTSGNTDTNGPSIGNKQICEKEPSRITKGDDGTVEVSYEEFLQSEGVDLVTCEETNQNDEDQIPQLTVPKCHKLFDYFKKKPLNSTVDITSSSETDVHVTQADVHFEPSPPHNNTSDLNQNCDREETRTSNILISDEECDLNILEISSEIVEVSPSIKLGQVVKPSVKESFSLKDEVNISQKTTQATLCFTKAGLTANKTNNKKNNDQTLKLISSSLDTQSQTTLGKTRTKGKKRQCLQKVKKAVNDESEIDSENGKSEKASSKDVSDSSVQSRRSSPRIKSHTNTCILVSEAHKSKPKKLSKKQTLRQRYKVAKLEAGGDNRSPIRIRLKRCSKSSGDEESSDVFSPVSKGKPKVKKSVIKAQKLLEKAKKSKPVKNMNGGKCGKEVSSKSSGSVSSMKKSQSKPVIKPAKAKKSGKLAPIFSKEKVDKTLTKSKPNIPLDVLCQKQKIKKTSPLKRQPSPLKRQNSPLKRQNSPLKRPRPLPSDVQVATYPPISANTHVQQSDTAGDGLNVWDLQSVTLKLKEKNLARLPLSGSWLEFKSGRQAMREQKCKLFRRPDELSEDVIERLLTEVQKNNPNFPVQRLFKLLKGKKDGACKGACVEESSKTVTNEEKVLPEEIVILDSPPLNNPKGGGPVSPKQAGKSGRASRLRRKPGCKNTANSVTVDNSKTSQASQSTPDLSRTTVPKKQVTVSDQLWSDKYQPSESVEIIGNSGCVRKLKLWLQKWKERSDKEARLLKKLLRKQHKVLAKEGSQENSRDWWTDDESDFEGSKDTDWMEVEDNLINTMLITGPHGVGKSSTVYALAQELGFQVLEVNTSSCRSGKRIVNKLQEATQSHRVSKQNLEKIGTTGMTPTKPQPAANKTVITSPAPTKLPTAFSNLFKKAKESTEPIADGDKKHKKGAGTKRKRALSKEKDCQSPKKKVKPEIVAKVPSKVPTVMIEESNNSSSLPNKSINLASNSLILFDEVDIVFEDDKGFWSSIQCFMNTSKRPIILTTSDRSFCERFEGKYDQIPFRTPHCVNVVTYLQLVCLVENVRTDFLELVNLVQLLKGDVRKSLQCLQWWVESGGGCKQILTPVLSSVQSGDKNSLYFIEDTLSQSQDSNMGDTPLADRSHYMDLGEDFKQARSSRRRIICDDSSQDSCTSPQKSKQTSCLKSTPEIQMSDENAMFPCGPLVTETYSVLVHQMCVESISGATAYTSNHFKNLFTTQNTDRAVSVLKLLQSHNLSILRSNIELFLPLPISEVDQLKDNWPIKSSSEVVLSNNNQRRVRIKINSCASDSSDGEWLFDKKITTQTEMKDPEVFANVQDEVLDTMPVEIKTCLHKSLRSLSDFYENSSYLDTIQCRSGLSTDRYQDVPSLNRFTVLPGLSDDLHTLPCGSGTDLSAEITAEISVRSLTHCYLSLQDVHQTAQSDPGFIDSHLTLPVLKGYYQFRLTQDIPIRQSSMVSRRKVCDDVIRCLPLHTWNNTRSTSLDYTPMLRSICHAEQCRQIAKTKRRFLHYLDGISLPLRESTLAIMSSSLR